MLVSCVVTMTQVELVPSLPCHRKAHTNPATVAHTCRVLDRWHTFTASGSYTPPQNRGSELVWYRLFLMVAIEHG